MNEYERELETLAVAVHGGLAMLHLLSLVYNVRRGNKFDSLAHALGVIYDSNAVRRHLKELR